MMLLSAHILKARKSPLHKEGRPKFPLLKGELRRSAGFPLEKGVRGIFRRFFPISSPIQQSGFTMLEILASIAIMAIAVLPLLGLIASTPAIHVRREREVRATFLAELRLEEVKGAAIYDYDFNLDGDGYTTPSPEDFPVDEGFKSSDSVFRYTISDVILEYTGSDPKAIPILRDITVTVWHDEDGSGTINGTETSVVLRTKVARRL